MKLVDIAMFLVYVATYIVVIPVGVGAYYSKYLSRTGSILLLGLSIVLLLDLLLLLFDLTATLTFLYLFSIADVLMMATIFSLLIRRRKVRIVFLWLGLLLVPFITLDAFFISGLTNNGFSNAVAKAYILTIGLYYLSQVLQTDIHIPLARQPMFWISVGVVTYNLVGAFDLFREPLAGYSQTLYLQYYIFWSIITIGMYIGFAYAFWLSAYVETSTSRTDP
ncbi:hypothetical protein [Spirosoma pollinicola]|uniref:Uncharacterized protein n=1 Tax=Spirosoma pollinicola TaxID=2057025 RepID=A0A2K8Z1J0_9BACT|nr:hypothetical protein [Spirosoma pollinicola]AUD03684.1 hypothetical protein CWM47_18730 [Spirosoma pollinicola]